MLTFLEEVNIVFRDLVVEGGLLGSTAEVYRPPFIHDGTHSFTISQHTTSSLCKTKVKSMLAITPMLEFICNIISNITDNLAALCHGVQQLD